MGVINDALLRDAYSYVPQSTVADLLNAGLLSFWRASKAQVMLQVHDSIVVQCPTAEVPHVADELKRHLTRPFPVHTRVCTIPVNISTGPNWNDLSKLPVNNNTPAR